MANNNDLPTASVASLTTDATASTGVTTHMHHEGRRRNRNRKESDPFLDLPDDAVKLSTGPSASNGQADSDGSSGQNMFANLILAPITMISFLLSLFVIERRDRRWRLSEHTPGPRSWWWWLDPEPYQDFNRSATAQKNQSINRSPSFGGWYRRNKHRAMARLEVSDAFELSGRVMVAMFASLCLGVIAITYAARHLYGRML